MLAEAQGSLAVREGVRAAAARDLLGELPAPLHLDAAHFGHIATLRALRAALVLVGVLFERPPMPASCDTAAHAPAVSSFA